jgi:hypothetical protein
MEAIVQMSLAAGSPLDHERATVPEPAGGQPGRSVSATSKSADAAWWYASRIVSVER